MTKNRNAFHINSEGTKPDSIQQGILWLDKLIKTFGGMEIFIEKHQKSLAIFEDLV